MLSGKSWVQDCQGFEWYIFQQNLTQKGHAIFRCTRNLRNDRSYIKSERGKASNTKETESEKYQTAQ